MEKFSNKCTIFTLDVNYRINIELPVDIDRVLKSNLTVKITRIRDTVTPDLHLTYILKTYN